ncbi:MAG: hypothetical protein AAFR51_17450 [Pseudomonadota bacterium]
MNSKEDASTLRVIGIIAGLFLLTVGGIRFFFFEKNDLLPVVIGSGCLIACSLWWLSERRENQSTKDTD